MYKSNNDSLFQHFIRGMDSKMQAELSHIYHQNRIKNQWLQQREREQLKKEIMEEVLSRISIMFETGEAIQKIHSLNKAIEQLADN